MNRSFSLRDQMLGGIGWVGLSQFLRYILQFVFIAVLARLLSVDDFGIIAIAMAFLALSLSMGDLGLSAAIVQKKDISSNSLSSALWACVLTGSLLFVIMLTIAPIIALFFHKEIITAIITVLSIKFIIDSFGIVHDALLRKELLFKRVAFIEICETLSFGLVSIGLAINGRGVWSLVYGYIFSSLLRVILLWIICPWRPGKSLSLGGLNMLINFAKNMFGFKATNYLASNLDRVVIGRLLGSIALGYYSMAYNISNFARDKISGIVNRVAFPAFSKIQDNREQLSRAYLKIITHVSLITFPLLLGLILLCPEFVRVVFTDKWSAMVAPLQYLCVAGMISSITTFVGLIFLATGHAEIDFRFSLISLFALMAAIGIGARLGILGIAIGICFYSLLMNIIGYKFSAQLIEIDLFSYIKAILPAITCSMIMLLVFKLFLLIRIGIILSDISVLISFSLLGVCTYLLSLYVFNKKLFRELAAIFIKNREYDI